MNPKNWDDRERVLERESKLGSIHTELPSHIRHEHFDEQLTEAINQVRYWMEQTIQDMAIPDNIISFKSSGFDINMDNMPLEKKYRFRFEGSRYIIWKNTDDELVVKEVE